MKKIKIVLFLFMMILIFYSCFSVFATVDTSKYTGIDKVPQDTPKIDNIGNKILGIIQNVGAVTSVIVLVVIGIKYIMASAEEKANLKGQLFPFAIGAILLFAGSTIMKIIGNSFETTLKGTEESFLPIIQNIIKG